MINLVKDPKNQIIEYLLLLDPSLFINDVNTRANIRSLQLEAGIEHSINCGLDRLPLHRHKIDERVIEIENDGRDQSVE